MKVWVTRDKKSLQSDTSAHVWKMKKKPENEKGVYLPRAGFDGWLVNLKAFKLMFGFTPSRGSCERYEFTLEEIKP